jgi:glycosyltransferase involved in cell wall biosynthesis
VTLDRYLGALRDGDQFICASEKQRDLWLGAMLGEGRINIPAYDRDPSGRELIDVVPLGLRAEAPVAGPGGPRARFPALGPEAEIVLWNGGIWSWLDAPTAVRAMAQLQQRRPQARLVFMGAATNVASRAATERAQALAAQLDVLDRVVFFNDRWVPYEERAAWLLEADCAISTHVEHLETRFAFRTRLLDCFWAGLPVVCTRGDDLAALIERDQLGAVIPEGDAEAAAAALASVLERGRDAYRAGLAQAAEAYRWERVAVPLVRYVTGDVEPPPLGPRAPRRAGRLARDAAFRGGAATLNRLGLPWPRL